ncbi:hypothetical protein ACLBWH_06460 [Sphingomonas sp. M6A6_1c]
MANASGSLTGVTYAPETAAVRIARKAFKTPVTKAPWVGAAKASTALSAVTAAASAVRSMQTIIDRPNDQESKGVDDVETSFITYRALTRLKSLAQAAQQSGLSDTERKSLQKAFSKGMTELQSFMAAAPSKQLTLAFGAAQTHIKGAAALPTQDVTAARGAGVVDDFTAPVAGLTGNEVLTIQLDGADHHDKVTVDLSKLATKPPSLEQIAKALSDAAASAGGDYHYGVKFAVAMIDGRYGLTMTSTSGAKVSLQQANAGNALMVVSGQQVGDAQGAADVYRYTDADGALKGKSIGSIAATDRTATDAAQSKAKARADAAGKKTDDTKSALPTVLASLHAQASTTGADGFTYVVGTTSGDMGTYRSKGNEDLFLTKVDSEGKIVWQHGLGVSGTAEGKAVSVAANGDVVVAGSVTGPFDGNSGDSSNYDMLVAKFSASGEKQFATSIPSLGDDRATAVTVGGDGSIYLGGRVAGAGDGGVYVAHLNAKGGMIKQRTIDTPGFDTLSALTIDKSGNLLALTRENGTSRLRSIDGTDLTKDLATVDLGATDARAIAIGADGTIAVAGATRTALPGDANRPAGQGLDGFVTTLRSDLTNARTTYVGSTGDDEIDSVAFMGSQIYVGGRTTSALDGARRGKVDGFVARIDAANGQIGSISQFGTGGGTTEPVVVSAAVGGDNVLGTLGLRRGALNDEIATSLSAQFGLALLDSFKVQLDGGTARKVTIAEGETLNSLGYKIRNLLGSDAVTISTPRNADGYTQLTFAVAQGHTLSLTAGPTNKDALDKLGIDPVRLHADPFRKTTDTKVTPGGSFGLGLASTLNLSSVANAKAALDKIDSAVSTTQSAYRSLYWDQGKADRINGSIGAGTPYQQAQLASYKAALARLTANNNGGGSFF